MSELTLYHAVPSRGLVVHWMLEELGVPFELNLLNMDAQEHKQPDYLAINAMGRVPAIKHGTTVVTETAAICLYLAEQFAEGRLNIAVDSPDRGAYLRWLFFGPASAEPAIAAKAMNFVSAEYQPFADCESVVATLVQAVAGKEFVVGGKFTAADIVVGSTINWGLIMAPVLPSEPALVAYWERLAQRPAWQRVLATMSP